MKLTSILLAAVGGVLAVAIAGCESSGVPRPSNATLRTFGGPLVQAHRGSRGEYDDNAVGGFRMCLAKGIRGFETDIRFTKDRKLVIMHDSRADRTTDGKGIVEEMTLEELRKCRLQACSEPVPTLEDVLAVFNRRGDVFVELEMKAYPSAFYTPDVLADYCRALSATARRMMAPGTYAFTCFNTNTLATMRSVDASAPMGLITGKGLDDSHIAVAKSLGCCSIAPIGKATTREMVGKAHAEGLSICLWMCQNKADWDEYAAKGADRVTSDYPVLLSRAIEGRPKKVVAMDLDATLCQHRSPIPERNLAALRKLEKKYKCVMVGAGNAPRIYRQMGNYPIDIVANYGMQVAEAADGNFRIVKAVTNSVDRKFFREKTDALRKKYGYTKYEGEPLEFHASGMVTFGLLGTSPSAEHKVAFDPDRKKRRAMYPEVCEIFKDFSVYIGGSTSFDFAGKEYNKYDATLVWAKEHGYTLDDVVFIGDDFADGGGDSHVRIKGMDHIVITDYKKFADAVEVLLRLQTPASPASRLRRAAPVSTYKVDLDRPGGLYRCGETATFKVTLLSTNSLACTNQPCASLDNFGVSALTNIPFDVSATGVVFLVSGTLREPGFLRLSLPPTKSGRDDPFVFSAGFEPEKIVKGSPSPADFDAFWAEAKARLAREVPLDPQVVRVPERSTADFDFYRISFATFGRRVHGYMSVPTDKSKAPFPVDFGVNAAGFGSWTNDMNGEKDSIRVQFSVYPFAPDWKWKENGLEAKYKAMDAELKKRYGSPRYCQAGVAESRESYFFYPVILGIDRAVDWVAARPDVDRSRFRYEGTSQGGGFGFYLCGLNRTFTKAAFYVPAITDTMGYLKGRDSGWPKIVENNASTPERRAAAEKWAPYFDGANFASRIACPVRVAVGFSDTTCPPCAVYAAFNEIKVADKAIGNGIGMTHSCSGRFYTEFGKWVRSSAPADEDKAYGALHDRIVGRFRLWPGLAPHETESSPGRYAYDEKNKVWRRRDVSQPELVVFRPFGKPRDTMVVVMPGGGYSSQHMGHFCRDSRPILESGRWVAVLHYRIPRREGRNIYDAPREDAARAIRILRANAARLGISPEKIGAVGFSAGAHLAAISATSSQDALYEGIDAIDDISAHLNFSIPVYPAYVVDDGRTGPNAHGGDGAAILPEFKFDVKTPPMFMLHGDRDYYSPMASVLLYTELHKRKIPAQLFVYANVSHGLGDTPNAKGWQNRIVDWLDSMGF